MLCLGHWYDISNYLTLFTNYIFRYSLIYNDGWQRHHPNIAMDVTLDGTMTVDEVTRPLATSQRRIQQNVQRQAMKSPMTQRTGQHITMEALSKYHAIHFELIYLYL